MIDYNYSNMIISFEKLYEKFQFSSFNLLIQYKQLHSEGNNDIIIMIINCLSSPLSTNAYWLKKMLGCNPAMHHHSIRKGVLRYASCY